MGPGEANAILECMAIDMAEAMSGLTETMPLKDVVRQRLNAIKVAQSTLRPVSREQVEKVWSGCEKCHNQDNWPSWIEKGFVYCPKCGTPLTSWAWEKQMKRVEALKDG